VRRARVAGNIEYERMLSGERISRILYRSENLRANFPWLQFSQITNKNISGFLP
jgi:hypothetical protein